MQQQQAIAAERLRNIIAHSLRLDEVPGSLAQNKTTLVLWFNSAYALPIFDHVMEGISGVVKDLRKALLEQGDGAGGREDLAVRIEVCLQYGDRSFAYSNLLPRGLRVYSPGGTKSSIQSVMEAIMEEDGARNVAVVMVSDGNIRDHYDVSTLALCNWKRWLRDRFAQFVLLSVGSGCDTRRMHYFIQTVRERILPYFCHPEPIRLDWHVPLVVDAVPPGGAQEGRPSPSWTARLLEALLPPPVDALSTAVSSMTMRVPGWARTTFLVRPEFPALYTECVDKTKELFERTVRGMTEEDVSVDECLARLATLSRYLAHLIDESAHPMLTAPLLARSYGKLLSEVVAEMTMALHIQRPVMDEPFSSRSTFAEYAGHAERLSKNYALIQANACQRQQDWDETVNTLVSTWPSRRALAGPKEGAKRKEEGGQEAEDQEGEEEAGGFACVVTGTTEREIGEAIDFQMALGYGSTIYRYQTPSAWILSPLGPLCTYAFVPRTSFSMLPFSAFMLRIGGMPPSIQCVASSVASRALEAVENDMLGRGRLPDERGKPLRNTESGREEMNKRYIVLPLPFTTDPRVYASPLFTALCGNALMQHVESIPFRPPPYHTRNSTSDVRLWFLPHAPLGISAARAVYFLKQGSIPDLVRKEVECVLAAFRCDPKAVGGTLASELWWWTKYVQRVRDDAAFRLTVGFSNCPSSNMHNPSQLVLAMLVSITEHPAEWTATRIATRASGVLLWFMMRIRAPEAALVYLCESMLPTHVAPRAPRSLEDGVMAMRAKREAQTKEGAPNMDPCSRILALCERVAAELRASGTPRTHFGTAVMAEFDRQSMAEQILLELRAGLRTRVNHIRFESVRDQNNNNEPAYLFKGWNVSTILKVFHNMCSKLGYGDLPPINPLAAALHAIHLRRNNTRLNAPGAFFPTDKDLAAVDEGMLTEYWVRCNTKRVRKFVLEKIVTEYYNAFVRTAGSDKRGEGGNKKKQGEEGEA